MYLLQRKKKAESGQALQKVSRKKLARDLKRDWQMYLFLLLPLIYIIIFAYVPMGGLQIAFRKYSVRTGIWGSPWVGIENIKRFVESYSFTTIVKNTLVLSAYSILVGFPLPIFTALIINCIRNRKYRNIAQTIITLPHFISVDFLFYIFKGIFSYF